MRSASRQLLLCGVVLASSSIVVQAGVNTWTPIGPEGALVRVLAIDPSNPSTVYAATSGAGLFKTIDSGSSWSAIEIRYDNGDRLWNIQGFAIDPANPQTIYAGAVGDLFKSIDGGASWDQMNGPPNGFTNVLLVDPGTPTRIYAGSYWGLSRSEDGGETFDPLYFPLGLFDVDSIAISPADRGVIYAGRVGGLVKSVDDGLTFDPIFIPAGSFAIDPSDADTLYAATASDVAIWKSVDGGDQWDPIDTGLDDQFVSAILIDPASPQTLYVSTETGGVFKSTDGGGQWNAANGGTISPFLDTLAIDPQNSNVLWAGATGSGVFRSLDGAGTWAPFNSGLGGALVQVLETHPLSPGEIFGGAFGLGFLKTANLGQTWDRHTAGFERVPSFADLALAPSDPDVIWAAMFGGAYQTTDGGAGWTGKSPPGYIRFDSIAVDPSTPTTVYTSAYSGGGSTFKSITDGASWTPVNEGLAPEGFPAELSHMVIDPSDPSTIYASNSTYGVFKTVDGADHWTQVNQGLSVLGATCVAMDPGPSHALYAGTPEGVYGSTNGGGSWSLLGVPPILWADDIVVAPDNPSVLYATHGFNDSGVFRSGDGGIHWNSMNPGLVNKHVSSFAVDTANPSVLYAGVNGAGVWVMTKVPISVDGIAPDSGPASGGTEIAVTGTALADEAAVEVGDGASPVVQFVSDSLLQAETPAAAPGLLHDVRVVNANGTTATLPDAWFADFLDVLQGNLYHDAIESIVRAGVTAGCGGGNYCPGGAVTRAQMAVLLLKSKLGPDYVPPDSAPIFDDVPSGHFAFDWIGDLYAREITGGCATGPLRYCPDAPVTRAEMAVLLLKTKHGTAYTPPDCTGVFADVACTPPAFAVNWMEALHAQNVTGGCATQPLRYCPDSPVSREQMAVFLVKTFNLP